MSYADTWTNDDGLVVRHGTLDLETVEGGNYTVKGNLKQFEQKLVFDDLPSTAGAVQGNIQGIPAGAVITRAYIDVDTAFTSGGTTTLSIGLKEADGTAIDADGIDVTVAKAALEADDVVVCDGALIGAKITDTGYISTTVASGPYTAGEATLVIEYLI